MEANAVYEQATRSIILCPLVTIGEVLNYVRILCRNERKMNIYWKGLDEWRHRYKNGHTVDHHLSFPTTKTNNGDITAKLE